MNRRKIILPCVLLFVEILLSTLVYIYGKLETGYAPFQLLDVFFFWGMIFFCLSVALMFGMENRLFLAPSFDNNSTYAANVSAYLLSIFNGLKENFTDFSTGVEIFWLSVINLIFYFLSLAL